MSSRWLCIQNEHQNETQAVGCTWTFRPTTVDGLLTETITLVGQPRILTSSDPSALARASSSIANATTVWASLSPKAWTKQRLYINSSLCGRPDRRIPNLSRRNYVHNWNRQIALSQSEPRASHLCIRRKRCSLQCRGSSDMATVSSHRHWRVNAAFCIPS